jgi:neutral ceramidase
MPPTRASGFSAVCDHVFLQIWLALLATCFSLAATTPSHTSQAGWAEVNITPPLGLPMGGRGPTEVVGKKVLDPLFAQVLYVRDPYGVGFALVSFDLVSLPHELSDRMRLSLVHELGVDWNLVVLNASHTHSGPQTIHTMLAGQGPLPKKEAEYFDAVAEKIVIAARAAARDLKPVRVEVFDGKSQVGINRRGKDAQGLPGMRPNPAGPVNEKLWVLKLTPLNGGAPAIVFSYGCHAVVVYGYAPAGISADFPGVTRAVLRKKVGAAHIQFVQGLAGDVRPRALADLSENRFRTPKPADLKAIGNQLAEDVIHALGQPEHELQLHLAGTMDRPYIARGTPPSPKVFEQMLTSTNRAERPAGKYWLAHYKSKEGFAKGEAWPVGCIRLADDQWVCYFGGEPCAEWEPKVKAWMAPRNLVLWGYCQEGLTYLPTDTMLPEGGYEVLDSNRTRLSSPAPLAPGIDEAIHRSLERQLRCTE